MNPLGEAVRADLRSRRDLLMGLVRTRRDRKLLDLVQKVDLALESMDDSSWSTCLLCHDAIDEPDRSQDPSRRICIDCLDPQERSALEADLESAARVQYALLPPEQLRHGPWEFATHWEPHGVVSGDHLDILLPEQPDQPVQLLLGDIAGKGLAASLLQAHLHALFRALAPSGLALGEMLQRANRLFFDATSAISYATLVAMRLYPDGRVELANAGHPRPLLADARGVRPLEDASVPLGMFEDSEYAERSLQLAGGDMLLLFTDGLIEAQRDGDEYGVARAAAALRRVRRVQPTLRELLSDCRGDLEHFLRGGRRQDDLSLVAVGFSG